MSKSEADAERGKELYKRFCLHCHTTGKGGPHRRGPNLFGIIGKQCGCAEGFKYSNANKRGAIKWSTENLDAFMENPKRFMPGTNMTSPVIGDPQDRRDIIAYLHTLTK